MRIIKAAKQQDERIETCYNCKSILGVTKNDIRWEAEGLNFKCPVCGKYTYYTSDDKDSMFKWTMEDEDEISDNNSMRVNTI